MRKRETPERSAWQRSAVQTASCPSETFHVDLNPIIWTCSQNRVVFSFFTCIHILDLEQKNGKKEQVKVFPPKLMKDSVSNGNRGP